MTTARLLGVREVPGSAPTFFPARLESPDRAKNVNKIGSLRPLRAKICVLSVSMRDAIAQ
jgi:hypothetical protein